MKRLLYMLIIILLLPASVWGYWVATHEKVTKQALIDATIDQYLKANLNISLTTKINNRLVREWIELGSKWEDDSTRWLAHFYDPTTGKGLWGSAVPSIIWGKDYYENVWSWAKARDYYYIALTHTDTTVRETNFAYLFRSLGQVMHLVHDKAVPAHVRNDGHTFGDPYERFVNGRISDANAPLALDGYLPVYSSADTSTFSQFELFWKNNSKGLAEFTNRNFVSRDTNFDDSSYQDYLTPVKTGESIVTETVTDPVDGVMQVEVRYIKGSVADNYHPELSAEISRLSAFSYFDYDINQYDSTFGRVYSLNNSVHEEYAKFLLPRAVGYSAGLLNYFFRGSIDITVPSIGFYALADASKTGFMTIKLLAKNVTANNEQMPNGSIELVVKYQPTQDVAFQYKVLPEASARRDIPNDSPVELTFNLPNDSPIPFTATDVYLQLVYHGRLGNEDGAVAVGFKDISEPTPIDIANNMDKICINAAWYDAGTPEAIAQVDTNHNGIADEWDVYPHTMKDTYIKISSASNPQSASPADYDVHVPDILAGNLARALYILSDTQFGYGFHITRVNNDPADPWTHPPTTSAYTGTALKNQTEYTTDSSKCDQINKPAPCYYREPVNYYNFRGTDMWWGGGLIYMNKPYPADSQCAW